MAFEVGDRVIAEKSGRRSRAATAGLRVGRHGVIEEVLRGEPRPRYQIRWDLGDVSIYSPANSGLHPDPDHVKPAAAKKKKKATKD
ncbi:MAG: hypothetical protein QOJ25_1943 [Solirubrobacteraceae bacterium]|jgi:hypothetical protein|nr:hypothetical protein [Solirubrobacteraceae bacterium]